MDMLKYTEDMYAAYSTRQMFRVARLVTPDEDRSRWVATADSRVWRQDNDRWRGMGDWEVVRHPDGEIREHLTEQLHHYGVSPSSPMWETY